MQSPLLLALNFNPAWISNPQPSEVWVEIIYSFPYFSGYTIEVGKRMDTGFQPTLYKGCHSLSMMAFQLICVCEGSQVADILPGVGITKAPFVNFSVSKIFDR